MSDWAKSWAEHPVAHKIYLDLQVRLGGNRTEDCLRAQIQSLASTVGFASETLDLADKICDDIAGDLKQAIRDNWEELSRIRSITPQD